MLNDLIPEEKQALEYLTHLVGERLADGVLPDRIADELNQYVTWDYHKRTQFVRNVQRELRAAFAASPEAPKSLAPQRRIQMLYGLIWVTAGLSVAGIIYLKSAPLALYIISLGAVLWGILETSRGFIGIYRSWGP
ncbi:MAG: hypothetical protein HY666_02850 [Chloroflexi bacterium]|nr:hypothetical protein [Chloroflexota bacterium]